MIGRLRALLWDPHEKLWNWPLLDWIYRRTRLRSAFFALKALVIWIDSALLIGRVVRRRLQLLGGRGLLPRRLPSGGTVIYVDCGMHRAGGEIACMKRWFGERLQLVVIGVEASRESFEEACHSLKAFTNLDLRHAALVGPDYQSPTVKLYKAGNDGVGDSLFAERGSSFELAPAQRLSEIVASIPVHKTPFLLRMNIEGAERFVIQDLLNSGLYEMVDGYYGMWDDLHKIDPGSDEAFRRELWDAGIETITFNGRDLRHSLRCWAIRFDVVTSILHGVRRKRAIKAPESGEVGVARARAPAGDPGLTTTTRLR